MKKIVMLVAMMAVAFAKAQSADPNIGIGLASPHLGINIRANFPGGSGGWARGYKISNQNNTVSFIQLGSLGAINNGVSTLNYSYIGTAHDNTYMVFQPDGHIGVGTTAVENAENWARAFQVHGSSSAKSMVTTANVRSGLWSHNTGFYGAPAGGIVGTHTNHAFSIITNASSKMTVLPNGNVGIGTATPAARLAVNGDIRAKEIKVETSNWPDYVFNADYNLRSLPQLDQFIQANGHLPEVPKAADAEADGVSLGEMNKLLLKKMEEMTLYVIDLQKQIEKLEMLVKDEKD